MIVLLLGPTKCGKSTQGKFLEQKYGLPALVYAEIFNKAVTEGTQAGQDAQAAVAQGGDVPEIIAVEMIRERIIHPDCADGFSLEGYPISMEQVNTPSRLSQSTFPQFACILQGPLSARSHLHCYVIFHPEGVLREETTRRHADIAPILCHF